MFGNLISHTQKFKHLFFLVDAFVHQRDAVGNVISLKLPKTTLN
jgi:hypothetical protein